MWWEDKGNRSQVLDAYICMLMLWGLRTMNDISRVLLKGYK